MHPTSIHSIPRQRNDDAVLYKRVDIRIIFPVSTKHYLLARAVLRESQPFSLKRPLPWRGYKRVQLFSVFLN